MARMLFSADLSKTAASFSQFQSRFLFKTTLYCILDATLCTLLASAESFEIWLTSLHRHRGVKDRKIAEVADHVTGVGSIAYSSSSIWTEFRIDWEFHPDSIVEFRWEHFF